MPTVSRSYAVKSGSGLELVQVITLEKSGLHSWRIEKPNGSFVYRSTMLPSGGLYGSAALAVKSARRIGQTI